MAVFLRVLVYNRVQEGADLPDSYGARILRWAFAVQGGPLREGRVFSDSEARAGRPC